MTTSRPYPRAQQATIRRLLNAYLRENGFHEVAEGPLTVPLPASGDVLRLTVTHASPTGHHDYAHTSPHVIDTVLVELARRTGFAGSRVLRAQIDGSIDRTARYLAQPRRGREGSRADPARDSEQSVLFGHPFHPTPKSAEGFSNADLDAYAPELGVSFGLPYFAVARSLTLTEGEVAVPDDVAAAVPDGYVPIPVHPWQARHLRRNPAVRRLVDDGALIDLGACGGEVYPTSSVRTVCDPAAGVAWKLPLHVRITNFVRNTPAEQLRRSADAARAVERLPDYEGFGIAVETGLRTLDPAVVGHDLAAEVNAVRRTVPDRRARVLAGLLDDPAVLAGHAERSGDVAEWLRRYVRLAQVPLLTAFADHGIAFEAHVQNSLLRLDTDGAPDRFLVRDMEGVAVSRDQAGELPADSPAVYDDEEAWRRLCYHAVTNQLAHVIHGIGRHTADGEASLWNVAAAELRRFPVADRLLESPELPAKANLLSRFTQRGERPHYVRIPNPLWKVAD
ncbi:MULTISPECIES: IucA/IucC family protein [Prauserella salsuginis group]|uniref:IucA/IucC family protein n=1 Tax=Prauserella salsuginis TaxID=387889 RepID=A0ABW6G765_9PSEU|nr:MULTISPECIES: IucA/IucC family protein [Prauserella salsuginis group]MCR3720798.1 Siderophore synthetase component [Prauserella flava]MCR3735121.1 Siderophore synthetase component [Prauserella salsuginis]